MSLSKYTVRRLDNKTYCDYFGQTHLFIMEHFITSFIQVTTSDLL